MTITAPGTASVSTPGPWDVFDSRSEVTRPAAFAMDISGAVAETTTDVSLLSQIRYEPTFTTCLDEDVRSWFFRDLGPWKLAVSSLPHGYLDPIQQVDLTPSRAVDLLRAWTGLPVTDIADLLGVARRSVYHWSTGSAKPRQEARLFSIVRALEPLSQSWKAWEFREWLQTPEIRTLVQEGPTSELSRRVDVAVETRAIRRLRPAAMTVQDDVLPLDESAIDRFLAGATARRGPRRRVEIREPRELTDSSILEEE
jgi:hypothetical protein